MMPIVVCGKIHQFFRINKMLTLYLYTEILICNYAYSLNWKFYNYIIYLLNFIWK